jgi:mannose/cellobiose epimerase-like protein (N-acyl-D-glucosamine 2-epimerase family)
MVMNRRAFIGTACAAATASAWPLLGAKTEGRKKPSPVKRLAGLSLEELREQYHAFLFDDFLPFMEKYVIDAEFGGFLWNTDRDGTRLGTSKTPTNEGRGIWVWSYLYNVLSREQKYLDTARRSVELILKSRPEGDSLWARRLTREGQPDAPADTTVYGDLYVAAGLAEYARAARDAGTWTLAKEIMDKCLRICDRPDYDPITGADPVQGPRRQGVSMLVLPVTTALLKYKSDPDVEAVAARAVEAVVNRHFNPDYRLNNEVLSHDYSRAAGAHAQTVSFGTSIQTLWMILAEGLRRKDRTLFDTAADRLRRHVEVGWDDVYGGVASMLIHVDDNTWNMSKPLHCDIEALVGFIMVLEHTGEAWAAELFSRIYEFTIAKRVLKKYGFPLWQHEGDRQVTYQPHTQRAEHFHNSRHLMMNLAALDRMIARGGKASDLLSV